MFINFSVSFNIVKILCQTGCKNLSKNQYFQTFNYFIQFLCIYLFS